MNDAFRHPDNLPPRLGPLGLGCATFGREIDEAAAHALMDHAVGKGVTHFDTATSYSEGASERIVGAWFASRRPAPDALMVATKIHPPYTPEAIDRAVAAAAARLGCDRIDVVYLHKWDETVLEASTLAALDGLVSAGRVRAVGASNFTGEQLTRAVGRQSAWGFAPFRLLQNNHNLAVRGVDRAMCAFCRTRGVAIVTYSPLGAGFLTGKHSGGVQQGSRFAIVPGHQAIYFQPEARRRLDRLQALSGLTGQSMAHLALAWALNQPGVDCVLIGGRSVAHLDQAFAARFADPRLLAQLDAC